jgi:hypothetical protein
MAKMNYEESQKRISEIRQNAEKQLEKNKFNLKYSEKLEKDIMEVLKASFLE